MISESDTDGHLAEVLEILKQQFESGNKAALLESIYQRTLMSRPLPEWLRDAFLNAYEARARSEIRSWDEVFDPPARKGEHLEAQQKHNLWRRHIVERVRELGEPIQPDLFDKIGQELGIGGTTASNLYYDERGIALREQYDLADRLFGASKKN